MGLFNDYLNASSKKTKTTKADSTKPEAPTAPKMAETPGLMTLDGRAPNAGVPPGRMLVKRPTPPSEPAESEKLVTIVPFVQQCDIQHDSAAVVPAVLHRVSNLQDRSSITQAWTQPLTQIWSRSNPQKMSPTAENHNHYHRDQHIHYHQITVPANADSQALVQSLSPTRQTHTLIKYVPNDPSPARYHPDPCRSSIQVQNLPHRAFPKNTTMRDFLRVVLPILGLSCQRGHGVQQVFPMENNVWGPGQIFEWQDGEAAALLGETELGKGYPDHEMLIARWTS
ncbi:MAG: hypothetical protein OHK93_000282 [Ramalina farinacea]|uniref:Uncharacterized protein n=1 Tax=Ramalina farinacea TaxID=258253 RepID=A0AA43TUX7_9LECA|nr:hypothetical protein [Ramalina farinacea]